MSRDNKTIYVFFDALLRKLEIDFPVPEGGKLTLKPSGEPDKFVLPLASATLTQKAHHVFWDNGMQESINALDTAGAGFRQTFMWLMAMRIKTVKEKVGFEYALHMTSNATKWATFKKTGEMK